MEQNMSVDFVNLKLLLHGAIYATRFCAAIKLEPIVVPLILRSPYSTLLYENFTTDCTTQ